MRINYFVWILAIIVMSSYAYAGNYTINVTDSTTGAQINNVTMTIQYAFYQETANVSTQEGGLNTGGYGTWPPTTADDRYTLINYSIPPDSQPYKWQTSHGTLPTYNTTFSSLSFSCYDTNTVYLSTSNYFLNSLDKQTSATYCTNASVSRNLIQMETITQNHTTITTTTAETIYDGDYLTGAFFSRTNASGSVTGNVYYLNNTSVASFREEGIYFNTTKTFTANSPVQTNIQNNWTVYDLNATISAPGYISASYSLSSLVTSNATVNLTPNTLNFTFIDESNFTRINWTTITVSITGVNYTTNFTTTNGTATVSGLHPDNYTIVYSAPGYYQRIYFYELDSTSTGESFTLYLLPQIANSTLFQGYVIDLFDYTSIPNATITLLKRNLTGTNYYITDQCITATDGRCLLNLQLYTTIYKFIITWDGVIRLDTGDQILADTTQTFQISITEDNLNDLIERNNISTLLSNTVNSMTLTWSESGNQITNACLTIYGRYKTTYTIQNRTCTTGSTGSINIGGIVTTSNDEVIGVASYIIDGNEFNYASKSIFDASDTKIGSVGFIMIGLGIPLTAAMAFLFHPVAAIPVFGLGIYLGWAGGYLSVAQGAIVLLLSLGAILFVRMRT